MVSMWVRDVRLISLGLVLLVGLCAMPLFAQDMPDLPEESDDSEMAMTDSLGTAEEDSLWDEGLDEMDEAAPIEQPPTFLDKLKNSGLVTLFIQGGRFMWLLLLCSVVGLAVIIERLITLQRAKTNVAKLMGNIIGALHNDGVEGAISVCEGTRGPIAAIIHAGLMRHHLGTAAVEKAIESSGTIEMSFLERGLIVLASVINIAPMLGFLGTVSGMIGAFNAIASAEQVNAKLVATGISEALITTASGLLIGIVAQAFYNYFISRIDTYVIEMEESTAELIDVMVDLEAKASGGMV
jgi:biopolymer transport protein ExbB